MNGLDPAMMQRVQQLIQQNPQLAMLLQKPGLMQKLQAIAQNPNDPMIAQQYASDPDVQQLISILGPAMGINQGGMGGGLGGGFGGMPGMGGMGGFGQNMQNQQQQQHGGVNQVVTYINSDSQFNDIIMKSPKDKLIVVDFFATWCGPCKHIAPDFERFAKLYKDGAIFLKVDVDRNKQLAQNRGIAAMPTFQFYKGGERIDEMRGANVRKLENIITKHISINNQNNQNQNINVNMKPSPYKDFPLHEKNRPIYTKAPFKKMKDKLSQLNNKFVEDEKSAVNEENANDNSNKTKYSLNDSEWKLLTQIMNMLQDKQGYREQRFNKNHYDLLDKLLTWPIETLPPVLDLIRVLALHPAFVEYCAKNIDFVKKIIKIGGNGLVNAVNGMLTCRIIINLFNKRLTAKVLEENFTMIVDGLLFNMMCEERKNTRLAFVRVLLHFSYCFYVISYDGMNKKCNLYRGEKLRCFALLTEILDKENAMCLNEKDQKEKEGVMKIILNTLVAIGTLLFRDENVIQFANTLDMKMIFKSYAQKYKQIIPQQQQQDDQNKDDKNKNKSIEEEIVDHCNQLIEIIDHPEK